MVATISRDELSEKIDRPGRFLLVETLPETAYHDAHLPGAINLPHRRINDRNLAPFGPDTLFVVYCDGPHCNGADRGALRLARLGRKVKKMIGGVDGWKKDGFHLVAQPGQPALRPE